MQPKIILKSVQGFLNRSLSVGQLAAPLSLSPQLFVLFLIDESSQLQTGLQANGDLRQHVGHLFLHELIACERHAKLDPG